MLVLTALGAIAAGVLLWAEASTPRLRPAAKMTASLGFIGVALLAGGLDSAYGRWVVAALILSVIGDAALLGASSGSFLMGLGAFLFAHIAYIGAFAVRGVALTPGVVAMVALAIPAFFVVRWLWPHLDGAMRGPVLAYASVISVMVAAAIATAADAASTAIPIAAAAFYLSDLAVARNQFVDPGFVNKLWGLPLYFAAQYLFAWTV